MKRVYVDTCVFISYITNEMNDFGNQKGQKYFDFFDYFYNKTYKLIISTWVIREIKKILSYKNQLEDFTFIENMIKELKEINNIEIIYYTKKDINKANELDSKNYPDALHAILALKSNSSILTTENIKDFKNYDLDIEILHPMDLI